jgi:hypothetical protein
MMVTLNRLEDRITGMVNGKPYSCTFSDEKYKALKELETKISACQTIEEVKPLITDFDNATKESYKEIVESLTPHLAVNKATNQFFLKLDTFVSKKPLPASFADRLIKSVEKGIEIEPLIKAWAFFLRPIPGRPAYTAERAQAFADYISAPYVNCDQARKLMKEEGLSEEVANQHATTTQVSITKEGLIVCYKVSEEVTTKYALDDKGTKVIVDRYPKTIDEDTGLISYAEPEHMEDRVFKPAIMDEGGDAFYCDDLKGKAVLGHRIKVGCNHYLESWNQVSTPGSKGLHCGRKFAA